MTNKLSSCRPTVGWGAMCAVLARPSCQPCGEAPRTFGLCLLPAALPLYQHEMNPSCMSLGTLSAFSALPL